MGRIFHTIYCIQQMMEKSTALTLFTSRFLLNKVCIFSYLLDLFCLISQSIIYSLIQSFKVLQFLLYMPYHVCWIVNVDVVVFPAGWFFNKGLVDFLSLEFNVVLLLHKALWLIAIRAIPTYDDMVWNRDPSFLQ